MIRFPRQLPALLKGQGRVAIYGGTFDPVHHGHRVVAMEALEQLRLNAVVFVPCRQSPHKPGKLSASGDDRAAMLSRALRMDSRLLVWRRELVREGPSYSVETAEEMSHRFPEATLFWLIGADQVPLLRTWHRYEDLKKLVTFAIVNRGESGQAPSGCQWLTRSRQIEISATEIRQRVAQRRPFEHLVPKAVAAYIHRKQLYRG